VLKQLEIMETSLSAYSLPITAVLIFF